MSRFTKFRPSESIRSRLTLLSTGVLFLGLVLGAVAFDLLLQNQLVKNLDQQLTTQALDRVLAIDAGLDPATQLETAQRETAVAVFDSTGVALASSGFHIPSQVADLIEGSPSTASVDLIEVGENEIERYDLRVVAAQGTFAKVVVGSELEPVEKTRGAARRLLSIGVPVLTLAGASLLWLVVGRSLRPVEQLRLDAQRIYESSPHGISDGRVRQPDSSDEISRLATTLNDMLERLERSSNALRRFVSDSSHELRSPIANIRARVETGGVDDWTNIQSDVVGEVERVEGIVNDLTYLARSDEGRAVQNPERVELDEILFEEAARLQQRGQVRVDASAIEPVVLRVDRMQTQRLIRNLVDNAERHADALVRLTVIEVEEGKAIITIEDDGEGISPADRQRVFERFARVDESRHRKTGGTGLGLAIVKDIAERHGGSATVEGSDLGGAKFTIEISGHH